MSNFSQITEGYCRPQKASPLFGRLPMEIRLMIFKFALVSCYATAWFDGEFVRRNQYPWLREPRPTQFRSGSCCFSHCGPPFSRGAFSFLVTCRRAYIEAFGTYWEEITLDVTGSIAPERTACGLLSVCRYLPAAVKANLGALRNVKLPILELVRSTPDDPTWTPALLSQLPKLRTLVSTSFVLSETTSRKSINFRFERPEHPARFFCELFEFRMAGETPAQYIENKIGVQLSDKLVVVSQCFGNQDSDSIPSKLGWHPRYCYFNWTTGMVYHTNDVMQTLHAEQKVMEAKPGTRWRRVY